MAAPGIGVISAIYPGYTLSTTSKRAIHYAYPAVQSPLEAVFLWKPPVEPMRHDGRATVLGSAYTKVAIVEGTPTLEAGLNTFYSFRNYNLVKVMDVKELIAEAEKNRVDTLGEIKSEADLEELVKQIIWNIGDLTLRRAFGTIVAGRLVSLRDLSSNKGKDTGGKGDEVYGAVTLPRVFNILRKGPAGFGVKGLYIYDPQGFRLPVIIVDKLIIEWLPRTTKDEQASALTLDMILRRAQVEAAINMGAEQPPEGEPF